MRNARYGRKYDAAKEKTWFDMKEDLEKASADFKEYTSIKKETKARYQADYDEKVSSWAKKWAEAKDSGAGQEELQKYIDKYNKANEAWQAEYKPKIEQEVRAAYVDQYHDWYKKNAYKYGLEYQFIPVKTKTKKGLIEETVMKSADAGDVVLDEQMNKDIRELTDKIMDEIMNPKKAKSFSDTIQKFNPYHDRLGRFTTAGGAASFTFRSDKPFMDNAINRAIEREKQRTSGGDGAANVPEALKGEYDKRMKEAQMLGIPTDNIQHEIELLSILGADKTVRLSGMDKELAAETVEQVKMVIEKYPSCKDAFGGFTTAEPKPGYFAESDNKVMATYSTKTGVIHMNKYFYKDKAEFEKKYAATIEKGFHPKGTNCNSVVVHEMGHALDEYVSRKLFHEWVFAMGQRASTEIWNADIKKYKKKLGLSKDESLLSSTIREALSGYAARNHSEYLAEGFCEVMCSSNPRPTAKSIVKRLENRIKKMGVD